MRITMVVGACVFVFVAQAAAAPELSCRPQAGVEWFKTSEVTEVPSTAVQAKGSEACDRVYHVDGSRYELGGCDHTSVGLWSPRDGNPLGRQHGRLPLVCQ
jgi:hypothetical protein